ncbi:MAG: nuclear transport factor 2 family protein [Pyrinomonadaceae bacterium]
MSEKNKKTVRKVTQALHEGDLEAALEFCADDVQWTHVGQGTIKGKDNVRRAMDQESSENVEPPKFSVAEPIIGENDHVVIRGDAVIKKNGRTGDYSFCHIYRFVDNKIAEINAFLIETQANRQRIAAS